MWMPCAQIRLQANSQSSFLDAFVDLKQMRMARANANPDDLWNAARRKSSNTSQREEKAVKLDHVEFFAQSLIGFLAHVTQETQGKMELLRDGPAHTSNLRIQIGERLLERLGQINRDKEAFTH
ncbi:MAG: hypothetical protein QOG67_1694 [Verrucomicrobiota bacterium]